MFGAMCLQSYTVFFVGHAGWLLMNDPVGKSRNYPLSMADLHFAIEMSRSSKNLICGQLILLKNDITDTR